MYGIKLEIEYFTNDSVVYGFRGPSSEGQIHVHFCRNNIMRITVIIISNINFEDLFECLEDKMYDYFGLIRENNTETETYMTVFYMGERVNQAPFIWGTPEGMMKEISGRLKKIENEHGREN